MIEADRLAHASRWRRLPLAEKALLCLGLLILAMALPPWPGAVLVLLVASAGAVISGLTLPTWLRLLAPPCFFILTGAATLLVQVSADGIGLAADGGIQAGLLLSRALAAVAALLLLTVTTPMAELVQGLRRLGLPVELAEVTMTTYRFIFILQDTASAMHASQMARLGGDGWRRRIRSAGLLAAALLPRALDQARRLEMGLLARGFDGSLRTLMPAQRVRPWRLAVIAGGLALMAGLSLWI
ncbi:cobalt ECF transporter T component CbiQ [Magnetospirillum sulfuroxidans]|uniref:Cobalt ECF transporter T component CbiQ n=1 Tax=Magnetospirillum sulfuroxidans TaxID=611300 RepID=A0ABS5IC42_9PROT|nr:cobalt ECF transporter T component CbiQ [Magnetospirillum sulfuroxidans]